MQRAGSRHPSGHQLTKFASTASHSTCRCLPCKLPFQHLLAGVAVSSRCISVAVLHCALNTVAGQPGAGVIALCAVKVLLQTTLVKAPAQPQVFCLHALSCVDATWPCGLPIWHLHVHVGAHTALMTAGHTSNCLHAIQGPPRRCHTCASGTC